MGGQSFPKTKSPGGVFIQLKLFAFMGLQENAIYSFIISLLTEGTLRMSRAKIRSSRMACYAMYEVSFPFNLLFSCTIDLAWPVI